MGWVGRPYDVNVMSTREHWDEYPSVLDFGVETV